MSAYQFPGALHEKQVAALNGLILEEEERQSAEKTKLRDELSKQFNANSTAQMETFSLMKSFDKERRTNVLKIATVQLLERFRKLRTSRMASMFRIWNTNTTLIGAAGQFHTQMNELVHTTLLEAKREKERSLEILRNDLENDYIDKEQMLQYEFNCKIENQKLVELQERTELDNHRQDEYEAMLRIEMERRDEELLLVQEAGDESIVDFERKMQYDMESMSIRHDEEINDCIITLESKKQLEHENHIQNLTKEWTLKYTQLENNLKESSLTALIAAVDEKDLELKMEQKNKEEAIELMRKTMLEEQEKVVAVAVSVVEQERENQVQALLQQFEEEKNILIGTLRVQIIEELEHSNKIKDDVTDMRMQQVQVDLASEKEKELGLKDLEREEAIAFALKKQAAAMEAERTRGLKLEASKWKQALKEAEKRLTLEVNQAKVDAREERDREVQAELLDAKEKAKNELKALTEANRKATESLMRDNAEKVTGLERRLALEGTVTAQKLVNLQTLWRTESENAIIKAESVLREQLSKDWTVRLQNEVVAALEQSALVNKLELVKHEEIWKANETALTAKIEELVSAEEVGRESSIQQEAASWRLLLKDAERKLKIEVEEARILGRDEREQELKANMEEVQGKQRGEFMLALEENNNMSLSVDMERQTKIEADAFFRFDIAKKKEIKLIIESYEAKQDQLRCSSRDAHKAEMDSMVLSAAEERAQALSMKKEITDSIINKMNQQLEQKDLEREEAIAFALKKQAAAMEAERTRGLKLEASKWKQALKEAEKRLTLEVNQAKVDAREERDREVQAEKVESARYHSQKILSLGVVQGSHEEKLAELRITMEAESEEAVTNAVNTVTEQLSAEWTARIKQEVDAAWEQATAVSASKVLKLEDISRASEQALVKKIEDHATRSLKLETAKWQKVVDDIQKITSFELTQARSEAKEQTIRELGFEMDEKENRQQLEVEALKKDLHVLHEKLRTSADELLSSQADSVEWKLKVTQADEALSVERSSRSEKERADKDLHDDYKRLKDLVKAYATERKNSREENERRLRELRTTWEEELTEKLQIATAENARILKEKSEEMTLAMDAERTRGLKLEASKWKQALKEAEKRLTLEVNQAKVVAREESDREVQAEMRKAEQDAKNALKTLGEEHKMLMEKQVLLTATTTADLESRLQSEKVSAIERAEKILREQLSEEWAIRLKKEVDVAWEQATINGKGKLFKSQEALENFKRDVTAQSQRLAVERSEVQERVVELEQQLLQLEASNNMKQKDMLHGFDSEMDALFKSQDTKNQVEIATVTATMKREKETAINELQQHHLERLKCEAEIAIKPMEKRLQQEQSERQEQVSSLNDIVSELQREKATLAADLSIITKKLGDEIDIKTELEQEAKKNARDRSFTTWKVATKVRSMRDKNDELISTMKKQIKDDIQAAEHVRTNLTGFSLGALQLSLHLSRTEDIRKKILGTLLSYRVDDLNGIKIRIKSLEKEVSKLEGTSTHISKYCLMFGIELLFQIFFLSCFFFSFYCTFLLHLSGEKDSIEEQRDDVEEEIERLEEQVIATTNLYFCSCF